MNKEPIIFIDTEDMEERYAEGLYMDYLKEENKQLKDRINKAIEYITIEQLYTNYQWVKSQYEKILKDLLKILGDKENE